jgi:nitrate reductase NapAB chaperone NapD
MSDLIVSFDNFLQKEVLEELWTLRGIVVSGKPQRNGTIKVRTVTRHLDDETEAIRSIEDIPGVIDVRLL